MFVNRIENTMEAKINILNQDWFNHGFSDYSIDERIESCLSSARNQGC